MKLKPGVEIYHKKKRYSGEIPDAVFDEIYGEQSDAKKEKFQFIDPKAEENEP